MRPVSLLPTLCLALGLAVGLAATAGAQSREEGELTSTPVRGSVHVLVMPTAGNVGLSVGEDGAFLIDDQFAPMTAKITAAVRELTDQPIRYVLNTHWHGDHTGGNANFGREGYVIVAHDNVRTRMSQEHFSQFFRAKVPPSPPEALPVITFSQRMTFHFNGDAIRVEHIPNAHTDGDAVFYFEKADVLHAGDVFVLYGYPFIDTVTGGSVDGMIAGLDRILAIIGPETRVIPGHGPVADATRVRAFRGMLVTVRDRIAALIREGKSLDEIVAARPLSDLDAEWGKGFIRQEQFLKVVHDSLSAGTGARARPAAPQRP
jgi:glyoxylase-like metal-dependent hydrolase (beta-lactamase superfamily II)